jgi:hypothetical protein
MKLASNLAVSSWPSIVSHREIILTSYNDPSMGAEGVVDTMRRYLNAALGVVHESRVRGFMNTAVRSPVPGPRHGGQSGQSRQKVGTLS